MERELREIQIDPPHPLLSKIARVLSLCFFTTLFFSVMGSIVWFFVFSPIGPRWADDFAGTRSRIDKSEVRLFTPMRLNLNEVALVLKKGDKAFLKAYASNVPGSRADVSSKDVKVRWYSECPSVAKVSGDGVVTAISRGTAFVKCVVENEDVNANEAQCLITVKDGKGLKASAAQGTRVFDGCAIYDAEHRSISFLSSKKIVLTGYHNHTITMRPGDRITNAYVSESGHLLSGKFEKGSNAKEFEGIFIEL